MPTRLSKLLTTMVTKASRGTLSDYVLNAPPQYGQPLPEVAGATVTGLITPERMREISMRVPTVSASVNAILDFSDGVPLIVTGRNRSKKADPTRIQHVQDFLDRPNPNDTGRHFWHQIRYDLTTLGQAAIEIERDAQGNPANLWVMDAARLRIDYDEHGTILGYVMIDAHGMPVKGKDGVHGWQPQDVIFFRRDPISHSVYSTSRITSLFSSAVIEDLMMQFISLRFTDSNIPVGVYDLGEVTPDELREAITVWNNQALKQHRILLTGSKGSKWYPFGYHLKDLEAVELLKEVRMKIMGILGVTMNELGESQDVNKSNGYNLSYTFKKRAIEPTMAEITTTFTRRFIWDELGYSDIVLDFEEIDSRDELVQAEIDKTYITNGVFSINHVKNRKGITSVQGGDESLVQGTGWMPVQYIPMFAQVQYEALEGVVEDEQMAAQGGGGANGDQGGSVSPPIVRPSQSPVKFTTPLGQGSSTAKIMYPRAKKENMGRARGPVQTMRNQGLRKEDM